MRMPGSDRAFVDLGKLSGYALDPNHPKGKHKARVFVSALGLTAADVRVLAAALRRAAATASAEIRHTDKHGVHYRIDFTMSHASRTATIRSVWVILHGETAPRFTSAWIE